MAESMYNFYHGNVSEAYSNWPAPDLIISDGAYGVRGFRGVAHLVERLVWEQDTAPKVFRSKKRRNPL